MGLFSSGNDASQAAAAEERRRKAEIAAGQRRIEGIFSSPERNQQIEEFIAAQRSLLFSDLNRTGDENTRQLKFSLARSGLSGGSTDIDQNRELAELFLKGTAEAERRAQNSGAALRSEDQAAKQQLFGQILGGADVGTAATNAAQILRNNTALAAQDSTFGNFDNLFSDFGSIFKNSRIAAGQRRANRNLNFGTLFSSLPPSNVAVAGGI